MWKLALERLCYVVRAKLERLKGPAKTEENRQIFKANTNFSQSFGNSGSKDTRVIDVLETTDLPEDDHRGIKDFSPKKGDEINSPVGDDEINLPSAGSVGRKQEELETSY